jgi:hypothetical protein
LTEEEAWGRPPEKKYVVDGVAAKHLCGRNAGGHDNSSAAQARCDGALQGIRLKPGRLVVVSLNRQLNGAPGKHGKTAEGEA